MQQSAESDQPQYLTTKEVAELLRVKERKVYDLAAAGDIPHRRITGKLLFPRSEIFRWIEGNETGTPADRPAVVTGSHDPLLDWAVRESGCGLATLLNGSSDGLDRFAENASALTGLHIPEDPDWNVATVAARGFRDCVLVSWAKRRRGLVLSKEISKSVRSVADLKGRRVAPRQQGAGAAALFERLLSQAGLKQTDLATAPQLCRTESDAAAAVAAGDADAALGIEAMALRFHLPFLPLLDEQFDLLIDRRSYFSPALQILFAFTRRDAFRAKAVAMGGYDMTEMGAVRWLSP